VKSEPLLMNVFAEDTYTKVESIEGQDIRLKIMDTCDNVSNLHVYRSHVYTHSVKISNNKISDNL